MNQDILRAQSSMPYPSGRRGRLMEFLTALGIPAMRTVKEIMEIHAAMSV